MQKQDDRYDSSSGLIVACILSVKSSVTFMICDVLIYKLWWLPENCRFGSYQSGSSEMELFSIHNVPRGEGRQKQELNSATETKLAYVNLACEFPHSIRQQIFIYSAMIATRRGGQFKWPSRRIISLCIDCGIYVRINNIGLSISSSSQLE